MPIRAAATTATPDHDALDPHRPDDGHLPLRDGEVLASVLPDTAGRFARAIVMPNLFLTALSGMRRDSHINGLRADGVSPGFLGMNKIVSDDSLSRALGAMDEARARAWLSSQFDHVLAPLLGTPWILDIDTTIKPLYGCLRGQLDERQTRPAGTRIRPRPNHPA